jgi:signal peptide peptidase SppA
MSFRSLLAIIPIRRFRHPPAVVAVLRLNGVIGGGGALRRGMSLATLASTIERAFKLGGLKAVALSINSPGGTPVQAALIAQRIRRLAEEKKVPVFAFAEDVAASGGYWLATAADEIFADENSIVGSIGVVSGGFGFTELIGRIGVQRRLYTSGERKAMLDPFLDEKPEDVTRLRAIQSDIHDAFKVQVRSRRGSRLKGSDDELFSGEFWTGKRALELGLIDGLGDLRSVMRQRFGDDVKLRPVGAAIPWWRRRLAGGTSFGFAADGGDFASGLLAAIEERLWWNRFGL